MATLAWLRLWFQFKQGLGKMIPQTNFISCPWFYITMIYFNAGIGQWKAIFLLIVMYIFLVLGYCNGKDGLFFSSLSYLSLLPWHNTFKISKHFLNAFTRRFQDEVKIDPQNWTFTNRGNFVSSKFNTL